MQLLSDSIERKYTDVVDASEWEILTDTGWEPLIDVKKTISYEVFKLTLSCGKTLECADNHIIFLNDNSEIFVCDLVAGDQVLTQDGVSTVVSVESLGYSEEMYDLGVNSVNHRFYTNGILSHNSTVAASYLLWYAMFTPDSLVLIASNKHDGALEIMQRIRFAYEQIPDHIRAGAVSYNKKSIEFDNGSRIIAQTTTENTGRGLSISCIYLDEFAFVRPGIADDLWKSLSPTLATGGKCIITSTPNTDEDRFAKIWFEAINTFDEYGNETKVGRNGFKSYKAIWSAHPDRDAKWASEEELAIGTAAFKQEHECLGAATVVTVQDATTNKTINISIFDLQSLLKSPVDINGKIFSENTRYQVLTPSGFKSFAGVSLMGHSETWELKTETKQIICTHDHKFFVTNSTRIPLSLLSIGDSIITDNGTEKIVSIIKTGKTEPVFDLIEVDEGHQFYANSILSSNCEFVGSEETLIDSMILSNIKGVDPVSKTSNHVRWYKDIDPAMTYIVSLDPSVGTGGDNAAIQVLEVPSLIQIAEWQHNKTPVEGQIKTLQGICYDLQKAGVEEIYWSVENNTLGEAALVVIRDTGEENIPGVMLHDPEMRKTRGVRKGFSTSNRKKLEACIKFKRLVERGRITLKSKNIISELKVFIRSESSFKAKSGSTDDLVTSMLMAIRMLDLISRWDATLQDVINSNIGAVEDDDFEDDEDYASPMPVAFL